MNKIAVLVLVAACGRSDHGVLGGDPGPTGGPDASYPPATDASVTSDGDSGVDPAMCPVGVADGCCPTAVAYGGHDPDCPSLGCGTLQESDPIAIDDDWQAGGVSGIGMAWTGHQLLLAWNAVRTDPDSVATIVYERRDPGGALSYGPVSHDDREVEAGSRHMTPELGFEPTSHAILFASSMLYQRYAETLSGDGAPASDPIRIGVDCNPIMARFQIYPWQGGFLVAQDNDPCGADNSHSARVDVFANDGSREGWSVGDGGIYELGMTFDAASGRIAFSGGNLGLSERIFTPPTTWSTPQPLAKLDTYDTGISVGDGRFLVVYGDYYLTADGRMFASDPYAGTWTIDTNGAPAPALPASALSIGANRETIAPRLVWTGDGWIELMSSFPWANQGLPDDWASFSTSGWSFAPDGSLREAFELDPTQPSFLVNAIWAGGRVAVTYATQDAQGGERRYLRFLSCSAGGA